MNIHLSGILAINRKVFIDQIALDPLVRDRVYKSICADCIFLFPKKFPILVNYERVQVYHLIDRDCEVKLVEPGEKIVLPHGGIILQG